MYTCTLRVYYACMQQISHDVLSTTPLSPHLSPPPQDMRASQQRLAVKFLDNAAGSDDVLLGGDLGWSEDRDGPLHLPEGRCSSPLITLHIRHTALLHTYRVAPG